MLRPHWNVLFFLCCFYCASAAYTVSELLHKPNLDLAECIMAIIA